MEKIAVLLYKRNVQLNSKKLFSLLCILGLLSCFFVEAIAQKTKKNPTIADKREIIKVLLKEKFDNSSETTIYISTINLPTEIQNDFPQIKNLKIQFVSPENSANSDLCAYQFGKFDVVNKYVSLSFGDCNQGLAYDFKKIRGKWKSVPFIAAN